MKNKYQKMLQKYNILIKRKVFVVVLVLFVILFLITIFYYFSQKTEVKLLDVGDFEELVKNQETFVLNVHTPYGGEIEGTDAIIEDWQNIKKYKEDLPEDKNTPIAVYCRSGRMSASATQQLKELGYKNIYDLKGGMIAWKESGRVTVNKSLIWNL